VVNRSLLPLQIQLASTLRSLRPGRTLAITILTLVSAGITLGGSYLIGSTSLGVGVVLAVLVVLAGIYVASRPEVGLYLLVAFVFLNLSDIMKANFGIPSIIRPLIALMLVSVIVSRIVQRKPLIFRGTEFAILVFGLVILISSFVAVDRVAATDELTEWIKNFALLLIVVQLSGEARVWKRAQWLMVLSAGFLALLTCYQTFTGDYANTFWGLAEAPVHQITQGYSNARATGPLGDPNFYGQILMMAYPMAVYRGLTEKRRFLRILGLLCGILIAAAVIFTYSRGASLSLLVVTTLIILERRFNLYAIATAVALFLLLIVPTLPPRYLERVLTIDDLVSRDAEMQTDKSFKGRWSEGIAAAQMFLDHPVLGVGPGNYPAYYLHYSYRLGLDDRAETRQAHNSFLELAAEKGILGILSYLLVLFVVFTGLRRAKQQLSMVERTDLIPWVSALQLGLVSYLLTSIFLHGDYSRYLWLLIAFAAACTVMTEALVRQHHAQIEELDDDLSSVYSVYTADTIQTEPV
jgi:putative inorganic carbon (hco3(-)) transporter